MMLKIFRKCMHTRVFSYAKMNPDRWAEITKAFALENEESDTGSARRCKRVVHVEENNDSSLHKDNHLESFDESIVVDHSTKNVKERLGESDSQKELLSRLCQEVALLKCRRETQDAFTQTGEERNTITKLSDSVPEDKVIRNDWGDSLSQPLSEVILGKIDILEKRMDALATFIQSNFPQYHLYKLGKSGSPLPIPTKPWSKPPALQPKPTCGSVLREIHSRGRKMDNKVTREGCNSAESPWPTQSRINGGDRDNHSDAVEQRLQYLESLVAQLKEKFMRLLILHRKNNVRRNDK